MKPRVLPLVPMAGIERGSHCRVNRLITCRQENLTCSRERQLRSCRCCGSLQLPNQSPHWLTTSSSTRPRTRVLNNKTKTSGNAALGRRSRAGSIRRRALKLQLRLPLGKRPEAGCCAARLGDTALGAVGGAIAGNAGKGAAVGAAGGGLLGVMRRNDQIRQNQYAEQQWAQQNVAQYQQHRSDWLRAVKTCLTGRGYTVQ